VVADSRAVFSLPPLGFARKMAAANPDFAAASDQVID
jgi:hypothetical protein